MGRKPKVSPIVRGVFFALVVVVAFNGITRSAQADSVRFCEYWPLAVGNQWRTEVFPDIWFFLEITDRVEVNGFEVWEKTYSIGTPFGDFSFTAYSVFVDGVLYSTGDLSDMDQLPDITAGLTPVAPEVIELDTPITFHLHHLGSDFGVQAHRSTLADVASNYSFISGDLTVGDFAVPPESDVLAFVVNEDFVVALYARDVGPLLFFTSLIDSGMIVAGCGISQVNLTGSTQYYDSGAEVSITIPGTVAIGEPIQWYRDGAPLSDGDGVSGSQSRTLMLSDVRSSDSGAYTASYDDGAAKALNSYGPVFVQVGLAALPVAGAIGLGLLLGVIFGLGVGLARFMPPGAVVRIRRRK